MINGEQILRKKYPNLDENQYQPAGIYLKLGKIETFKTDKKYYGIIDDMKILPERSELVQNALSVNGQLRNVYTLRPNVPYIATTEEKIKIDKNSLQFYKPRSTLLRCGANVMTAIGDPEFNNKLSFLVVNFLPIDFVITKGERFAQLVDIRVDGVINGYNGDYQSKK